MLRNKVTPQSQRQPTQGGPIPSIFDLATPPAKISAFCQAVLKKIIPRDFWGNSPVAQHNENTFLKKVDHFILLRRFEAMSLHETMQDMKVGVINIPPHRKKI